MDGKKPHLLKTINNNLGAETSVEYATSTKFYLEDKAAGIPWLTRLSFPVLSQIRSSPNQAASRW